MAPASMTRRLAISEYFRLRLGTRKKTSKTTRPKVATKLFSPKSQYSSPVNTKRPMPKMAMRRAVRASSVVNWRSLPTVSSRKVSKPATRTRYVTKTCK